MELSVGEASQTGQRLFTGFVRDLTERQQTERRLHELQDGLLHVSRVRSMGQMAAALAHELNQPLTATANYVRAALRLLAAPEPNLERVRQAMNHAVEQTLRSGEIIRRLRAFVARGEVARQPESIAQLIEEASALALVGAKERGVKVLIGMDPDLPDVSVDRVQIQQVLLNLIRNAMEAMEGCQVRELAITASVRDDHVLVSVADTGSGIPPEIEARLFQPFVTTKSEGMGIGLSVCRTIVEAHGGRAVDGAEFRRRQRVSFYTANRLIWRCTHAELLAGVNPLLSSFPLMCGGDKPQRRSPSCRTCHVLSPGLPRRTASQCKWVRFPPGPPVKP